MLLYGQPTGAAGYDLVDGITFAAWMPVLKVDGDRVIHPWQQGYKVHVSVAPIDADRLARTALPQLQAMRVDHKIYASLDRYQQALNGPQRGKFITIYPGPVLGGFTSLINRLDPVLARFGATPGPRPLDRSKGHRVEEQATGTSGLLSYTVVNSYQR